MAPVTGTNNRMSDIPFFCVGSSFVNKPPQTAFELSDRDLGMITYLYKRLSVALK